MQSKRKIEVKEGITYIECTSCHQMLPATTEYFYPKSKGTLGVYCRCKKCEIKNVGLRRKGIIKPRIKRVAKNGYKICSRCGKELLATIDNFSNRKISEDGLSWWCRQCEKERKKEYDMLHKEQNFLYRQKHRAENREKLLKREKIRRDKNKEYLNSCKRKWARDNKDKILIYVQRRNALKRKLANNFTLKQWNNCKNYFRDIDGNLHCAYCSKIITKASQEHFIPLSKGGEYTVNNIIPVCCLCNSSKGNKDFFKWYPQQSFYSKENEIKILKYLNYKNNNMQQLALI